jgi:catechol 2,3-dioxygenase-like lactoylglutathione lyase family enzyme
MVKLSRVAPELPVSDLKAALRFYEQHLGFAIVAEFPAGDYAIVERDGVALHLFREDEQTLRPVGLHIFTDQLDELQQELKNRGVRLSQEIARKPWGTRDFRVNDIAGNQIKFTEPSASG